MQMNLMELIKDGKTGESLKSRGGHGSRWEHYVFIVDKPGTIKVYTASTWTTLNKEMKTQEFWKLKEETLVNLMVKIAKGEGEDIGKYFAVDGTNKPVHFNKGDKLFVRVLGITKLYTENKEIFHPGEDDTIFSGDITFPGEGVYLVKACLGPSMNLDEEGNKVWPFGCFEDTTSVQINVYKK